jgi:hypothetical protein
MADEKTARNKDEIHEENWSYTLGPQKRNEILNFNQFLNLFRIIGPT